jgi:hypothetical protein
MPMLLQRAMMVSTIAALILPQSTAFAEEAAPATPAPVVETAPSSAAAAPAEQPEGTVFHARPAGLVYRLDARDAAPLPETYRFDFERQPMPATGIRLAPAYGAYRGGWSLSGRAGPVRWLTPLSSEGTTVMRFGGRVPGQPRTPGLGLFNLSAHYEFE